MDLSPQEMERAFLDFHRDNPHVYQRLVDLVGTWIARRGHKKLGIGMLFEVLRWEVGTGKLVTSGDDFKLNNNFRAYYTRLLERDYPEWDGLFEKRRSKADLMCDPEGSGSLAAPAPLGAAPSEANRPASPGTGSESSPSESVPQLLLDEAA